MDKPQFILYLPSEEPGIQMVINSIPSFFISLQPTCCLKDQKTPQKLPVKQIGGYSGFNAETYTSMAYVNMFYLRRLEMQLASDFLMHNRLFKLQNWSLPTDILVPQICFRLIF